MKAKNLSIRTKVIIVISVIVALVTAANTGLSIFFARTSLLETVKQDAYGMVNIADELVGTKLSLLKSDANVIASRLLPYTNDEILERDPEGDPEYSKNEEDPDYGKYSKLLANILADGGGEEFSDFIALTIFNATDIIAYCGEARTHESRYDSQYLERAREGITSVSTSRYNDYTGMLVLHVCAPIDPVEVPYESRRVLSVTIPGMIFNDLLNGFKVYETGNIFLIDEDGILLSNVRPEMVEGRYDLADMGKTDKQYASVGGFVARMRDEETGDARYTLGKERIGVWKKVTNSTSGWTVGVAAPISESPATSIMYRLLISAAVFFVLGTAVAFLFSGKITRVFQQIEHKNDELAEVNAALDTASKAKTTFLANTSHEMRTPLNAVIGLSELTLGLPSLSNEAKSNTEKVYNAGMTLLGIVNDILDLSKIEAGKLTITPVEYDLASVINDTATLNVIRIGSKPLKFNINIDGSLPAKLYGDDMRVKQIFNNLLSNAFKYTNEGAVDLYIECEHEGTSVILTVKVKDTGIGIAADSLAKIFSKYGQVNAQSNRKIEGTGLGLSITKQLATLMGGDITVESKLGEGSTFTVTIRQGFVSDVKLGDEVAANLASMQYIDGKRHRNTKLIRIPMPYARILVVDDMPTNLDVALGILRPYGMQVDCVTSGIKAIDLIRKAEVKYDAIFMDHMMPDMDGITATEIIRRDIGTEYAKTVPILALTANAIVGNEKMFLEHGFDAFLSKPIDILAMDAAIRKFIRHKDKEKEWAEIHGKSDIPVITPHDLEHGMFAALKDADLDVETALNRFDNDANVYAEILASYVKNTAPLLDILRAVTRESIHNYGVMVHGLKSSSRSIGAISIGERAEDLECAAKAKDFDFIRVNNGRFIERLDELIGHISKYLKKLDDSRPKKERKARPSAEVLDALLKACISFDVDEVDEAMTELEKYDYDGDAELVEWIHTQAEAINYKAIIEKLSQK